ncbi:MAG: YcxB family protein [Clostridia bacterium]|nr:YcxB family protein [Clostridia bacterium]
MSAKEITIPVRLDGRTFKKFSRFDMFRLRRRWVRPVVFALILLAFAAVALLSRKPQAGLIAAVLLVVGMGLPLVYFGTFFAQVNLQAVQRGLDRPKRVYTVRLDFDGVHVTNDQKKESPLSVAWKDVQAAFHVKGCVYLYISPVQAFLLPDGQANVPDDEVRDYLKAHMGEKCRF